MENFKFNQLKNHLGHNIECVRYGNDNISIECTDCNEVLYSEEVDSNE